ncbi:ATP-grasp domain-containing protein [Pseudomonas sp. TKO26]|uniref:ATP-grasp domain-containing protein n=1 Tax=unclassified Pseudomonas TaxID=196821 RepID=UPI000DA0DD4C|nr:MULTISPECIES: ATP-grasp domain-containing protein [unclassified Pseudomonas]PYY86474.1 ATP-grasp domain-containing protein [Pseudomonas sp. TKO30]PYY89225.1 ATP-grasp domain-containing protein [Pseudomonas sp. TKO29]PYY91898.1 ATP-grasp domain-containing protein [Pseudomonas sp. TKO26]PYZ00008.1 ATP-grasp domain-containing protein [Pseudomonas sp. TKO14]
MHVLILGARAPACLEWARAFSQAGWTVTVADSLAQPLSRFSRAARHFVRLPEPRHDPDAWIEALAGVIRQQAIDLLLPTCEEVFYLAHGLERLRPLCRVFTSDFELLHRLHHKGDFAAMTRGWDVAAPPTQVLHDPAGVQALAAEHDALVFKPAYSRFASQTLIRPSPAQLAKVRPSTEAPWVAQQFVPGQEHCSFSVLVDGQLRAHSSYQPRYRVGRGSGIYFHSGAPAPIRAFLEQFGRATGYTGQVGFDFIEDQQGRFHVLECNPRATSGVHLFDDQRLQLVAALGSEASETLQATLEPRMIALAMLLLAAPQRLLSRAFWHDYQQARDVIVQDGDRGPLTAQLLSLGEIIGRALTRRCGLLAASTADIEWNGQPLGAPRR